MPKRLKHHRTVKLSALSSEKHHFLLIFILSRLIFLIITSCCKCRTNIVQERSRANIEQKDKTVRNIIILLSKKV